MRVDTLASWMAASTTRPTPSPKQASPDASVTALAPPSVGAPERTEMLAATGTDDANNGNAGDGEKSLAKQIAEGGFTKFVADLEAKKMEELRAKILESMGLSEDDLTKMPAEQRAQIEQMVEDEIKRRMEAAAALRKDKDDPTTMAGAGTTSPALANNSLALPTGNLALGPQLNAATTGADPAAQVTGGMGLGPLLALQERDASATQKMTEQHGKNDVDDA